MIWRLMHKLLGYDYVQWSNCVDQGVARVFVDGDGVARYWRYRSTKVMDMADGSNSAVVWLTCKRSKYISEVKP